LGVIIRVNIGLIRVFNNSEKIYILFDIFFKFVISLYSGKLLTHIPRRAQEFGMRCAMNKMDDSPEIVLKKPNLNLNLLPPKKILK